MIINMKTLNIIVPAYNEEDNIDSTIKELVSIQPEIAINYKIIVINDNSHDNTQHIVEKVIQDHTNVVLINRKGNHGLGRCISRGFEEVIDGYVCVVMADLADDIADIPIMLSKLEQGADLVSASRYLKGGKAGHHNKLKGALSRLLGFALKICTGMPTCDATNAFKMYRSSLINEIGYLKSDNYTSGLEVLVKAYCNDSKIEEIPTKWNDRNFGSSSFKIIRVAPEYIYWFLWTIYNVWKYRLFK